MFGRQSARSRRRKDYTPPIHFQLVVCLIPRAASEGLAAVVNALRSFNMHILGLWLFSLSCLFTSCY